MRIPLTGLGQGQRKLEQILPAQPYLNDLDRFPGDLTVQATVEREGNSLKVILQTSVEGHFTCDRCGKDFVQEHHGEDTFYYTYEVVGKLPPDSDISILPKNALELDVTQEIRDIVFLELPIQFLCKSDCKGLCSDCGADLNVEACNCQPEIIDPRWEALLKLKESEK
jgi:uncharacterized protein